MLRRLLVMRHAKSSWKSDAPTDHARPLNKRGRRAAPYMGRVIHELGWDPQQLISSDAQRTRETWARCVVELEAPARLRFTSRLYLADLRGVCAELAGADDRLSTLMALGHNPWCEELCAWLSGEQVVMKTASVALLEAPLEHWRLGFEHPNSWRLSRLLRAR